MLGVMSGTVLPSAPVVPYPMSSKVTNKTFNGLLMGSSESVFVVVLHDTAVRNKKAINVGKVLFFISLI